MGQGSGSSVPGGAGAVAAQGGRHPGDRLRVAFLALEWPVEGEHAGGVGRYVERLAEALRDDVDLVVVARHGARPAEGVEVRPLPPSSRSRFVRYYTLPLRMRGVLRTLDVDVVHSHGDDFAVLPASAAPILRTFYGSSLGEALFDDGRLIRRVNHVVLAAIERLTRPAFAAVVDLAPRRRSRTGAHVIPPVFGAAERPAGVDRRPRRVVFIGSHDSKKRGDLAVRAAAAVRGELDDLELVVVGPEGDAGKYPSWVDFRSGMDDGEVLELLAGASVLLAPSRYEGFGIPAWEALRVGTLALCTPNPGSRYIAAGGYCRVVPPRDLAPALRSLLTLPDEEDARLRSLAVARAEELAREGAPSRYLGLYRELAAAAAAPV